MALNPATQHGVRRVVQKMGKARAVVGQKRK